MAARETETLPLSPALPRVSSSSSRARATALARPGPDPLLVICRCFSFVTSLTAILCVAVNVLSAVRSFKDGSDVFDGIFRCYAVVIAFIVVVAETEWGFVIKFWKILEYWAGRGMLQILEFCALAFSNGLVRRKKLRGSRLSRIWRHKDSEPDVHVLGQQLTFHLLPFPCQFDELLGTDHHLVSGKYFTSEVEEDNFGNLKYRMLVL
ncbi:hypothetical protein D5086_030258 [Populus alba]|uniref:Uncharacterized protein n=1 Tax=Populus alba TaxID=43335 RepID=A0ACC4ANZ3_POPAL